MEAIDNVARPAYKFYVDSRRFLRKANKPNAREFRYVCTAVAIGFAIMGFVGFAIKLIHIPINAALTG